MVKNGTVLRCPKCGSIYKKELKPDFFQCNNCQAIYSLQADELSLYTEGNEPSLPKVSSAFKNYLFLVIALMVTGTILLYSFHLSVSSPIPLEEEKPMDYDYIQDWVYVNTKTQQPVLLRLASASIDENDRIYDFIDVRIVFIDPMAKKRIGNQILLPKLRRLNNRNFKFHSFSNGAVYMTFNTERIFKLDQEKNQFIEVTKTMFGKHPELDRGILTIDFMTDNPTLSEVIAVFTNDKKQLYDVVTADKFFTDLNEAKVNLPAPGKKYAGLDLVYHQKKELLVQNIDSNTHQVKWTFPMKGYVITHILKYNQGFAIQYGAEAGMDGDSGLFLISNRGKLLTNYVINNP